MALGRRESEGGDEHRHREADRGEEAKAGHAPPSHLGREASYAETLHNPDREEYAGRLAYEEAGHDTKRHTVGGDDAWVHIDEGDTSIGEGEDGHDDERDDRMEAMLETLKRRDGGRRCVLDLGDNLDLLALESRELVAIRALEVGDEAAQPVEERGLGDGRRGGNHKGRKHGGNGGMDARHEERGPDTGHGDDGVEPDISDTELSGDEKQGKERHAYGEVGDGNLRRVEEGYDEDRAEVVDNGERGEEHLGRERDTVAKHIDDGKGEGYVGGHRDSPAGGRRSASVERQEDERRDYHAENGRADRHDDLADLPEFATDKLAFEFEAYDKKEERHQAVVDPMLKAEIEIGLAIEKEAKVLLEEMEV